jgi:D-sedoheptulose 7-phosphate isomerase
MTASIQHSLAEHRAALEAVTALAPDILRAAECIGRALREGGRVFACGNGGSAADAQHFAAELTGRFERERRGLAGIALTTDTSALTAIGNDYGFEAIFARQLEALGRPGDVLLALSTSGHSPNVLRAVEAARAQEIATIGLLGRDGGALAGRVDQALIVPVARTARIQEMHILILHLLCEAIDHGPGTA